MAKHKFAVGDRIRLADTLGRLIPGVFTIVRLMPPKREDMPPAYRVKSGDEGHERMVKENEVHPA